MKFEAASNLTYQNGGTGTAGDKYTGLDLFGRIVETIWIKGTGDVVQSLYGHNRASSILWRKDEEASNTIAMDAYYEYDGLQQVTEWKRGNLSPSTGPPFTGVTSQKQGEDFTYDQTGNWLGDVSDNPNFTQSRTHDVKNQITSITGPTGVIQPDYDNAGNTTLAPSPSSWTTGYTYKWDAWNRLVEIKQGGTVIGSYAYDALTRRTRKTVGGVTRDIYYDRQWRSVEERDTSTGTVKVQHAWSPLDRWTLIRRKRNASGSTLNETLFCLRDYLDPVALANTSGAVVERYSYDAFGTVRIMNAAFGVLGNSAYDWDFLYHGEFRDKESELYNYGYRYLDTQLGRWLSRDPIGEDGGLNLYGYADNDPVGNLDFVGLVPTEYIYPKNLDNVPVFDSDASPGIQAAAHSDAMAWCSCDDKCDVSCRVIYQARITIYKKHVINRAGMINHELRHVMSRAWRIAIDVVHPLRARLPFDFDNPESCEEARARYEKETRLALESALRGNDHKKIFGENDKKSTKWSPYDAKDHDPVDPLDLLFWQFEIILGDLGTGLWPKNDKYDKMKQKIK